MTRQSPSVAPETLDFYQKLEAAAGGIDKTGALEEVNDQLMHIGGDLGVAAAMNPVMLEDTVKHAADRVQATIDDERSETGKLQIGPDNEKAVDAYHLALIARYAGNEVFTQLVESNGWIQVDPEVVKIAQNKPLATLVGAHA